MKDFNASRLQLDKINIKLDDVFSNLQGGIAIYQIGKKVETLYSSNGIPKLSGRTKEEYEAWVKDDAIFNMVYEKDVPKVKKMISTCAPKGEPAHITFRVKHKDGSLIWIQLSANKIEERDGEPIYYAIYTRSSEEASLFQTIVEDAGLGVVIAESDDRRFLYANKAGRDILSINPKTNIIGKCVTDILHGNTLMTEDEIKSLPEHKYRQFYKTTEEGKYLHVSGRSFIWNGTKAYVCFVSDETELMKVQQHIEQKYEYELQMRNELINDAIIYYQLNISQMQVEERKILTDIVEVLDKPAKFTEDICGSFIEKYVADEYQHEFNQKFKTRYLKRAFRNDKTSIKIPHFRLKNHLIDKWCSVEVSLMERPGSNDLIAMVYVRDVDEAYKKELAMSSIVDEEIEYVSLVSAKDGQGIVLKASPDCYLLPKETKFDFAEFSQDIVKAAVDEDKKACIDYFDYRNMVKNLEATGDISINFSCNQGDGKIHRKKSRAFYLDELKNDIVIVRRDITEAYLGEQERAKVLTDALNQAQAANRAKSAFLSRVSHDMRTPLNGILGLTHLMKEKSSWEDIQNDLAQLEMSGQYLLNLINDTLEVSKIENDNFELQPTVCEGQRVMGNIVDMLQPNVDAKKLNLTFKTINVPFTTLYIDVGRLEQLLVNVIGNAIKFTPEGGNIECTLETIYEDEEKLIHRFTVKDTGIGMSEEFLPHLFEPFSQEDSGKTSKYQGTGLGMTISKQIVELMGGEISVKSQAGKGTELSFTMVFPKATKEQKVKAGLATGKDIDLSVLQGRKVLICEDHPLNVQIIVRLLNKYQIEADIASNGAEGVEMFKSAAIGTYDCILMDIRMPVMDGLEATSAIRNLDRLDAKSIPIIAMTANALSDDMEESERAGMNAHLSKPLIPKVVYETIARYMK